MNESQDIQEEIAKGTSLEKRNGGIDVETNDQIRGRVTKDGTLEWYSDVSFEGSIQGLGSRVELWQDVIRTGDNLITLNENVTGDAKEPPYAGIKVNRGDEKDPAYLLWDKKTRRWVVSVSDKKKIAVHDDPLSKFEMDLTTDDISEGTRKYFSLDRLEQSLKGGNGISVNRSEDSLQIDQTLQDASGKQISFTNTHNFWVSNEVVRTRNTDREILPAIISSSDHESKKAIQIRGRLSAGQAEVVFLKNGKPAAESITVGLENSSRQLDQPLEDGDLIGIGVKRARGARNLSVSISVLTNFLK